MYIRDKLKRKIRPLCINNSFITSAMGNRTDPSNGTIVVSIAFLRLRIEIRLQKSGPPKSFHLILRQLPTPCCGLNSQLKRCYYQQRNLVCIAVSRRIYNTPHRLPDELGLHYLKKNIIEVTISRPLFLLSYLYTFYCNTK